MTLSTLSKKRVLTSHRRYRIGIGVILVDKPRKVSPLDAKPLASLARSPATPDASLRCEEE